MDPLDFPPSRQRLLYDTGRFPGASTGEPGGGERGEGGEGGGFGAQDGGAHPDGTPAGLDEAGALGGGPAALGADEEADFVAGAFLRGQGGEQGAAAVFIEEIGERGGGRLVER